MRRLLLRAHVWLLAGVLPLLDKLPLKRLLPLLTPRRPWRLYQPLSPEEIVAAARRRLRRPLHMRRRSCLRLGLTTWYFLRLAGQPAEIHFGVFPRQTPDQARMHGHCWVLLHGRCLTDPPGEPVAELFVWGANGSAAADNP